MDRRERYRTRKGTGKIYRIVVRDDIGERFALVFEEMEMEVKAIRGNTILTGEIVDQPHLHGVLDRIGALGLELLSVECLLPGEHYENDAGHPPTADQD